MTKVLIAVAAFALGCLTATALRLPWFLPLDGNAAEVLAATASALLAVAGAFALWRFQARQRQRDLALILAPMFQPIHTALCAVRTSGVPDEARRALREMRASSGQDPKVTDQDVAHYQAEYFPDAVAAAVSNAEAVVDLWKSVQDLIAGLDATSLREVISLYVLVRGAPAQLRLMEERATPKYLAQIAPVLSARDRAVLDYAIGSAAKTLNRLDKGSRDESVDPLVDGARTALLNLWTADTRDVKAS